MVLASPSLDVALTDNLVCRIVNLTFRRGDVRASLDVFSKDRTILIVRAD